MKLSESQELQLQGSDLEEMAAHPGFRNDVMRGKRSPARTLLPIARKYWITDLEWLRYVIRNWDGHTPLPAPSSPQIERTSQLGRYDLWRGANGVLSVQTESSEASPRMLRRTVVTVDQLGSKWLVLKVRLFPGLRTTTLKDLIKEGLDIAAHRPISNKKPSKELVAHQFLDGLSSREQSGSTYRLAKRLAKDRKMSFESAKKHVRSWKKPPVSLR